MAGATRSLVALVLVVKAARDRMMAVVDLGHQVRDGQLQLMCPQATGFVARRT